MSLLNTVVSPELVITFFCPEDDDRHACIKEIIAHLQTLAFEKQFGSYPAKTIGGQRSTRVAAKHCARREQIATALNPKRLIIDALYRCSVTLILLNRVESREDRLTTSG